MTFPKFNRDNPHLGHRQRLKEKFDSNANALRDYELVEMLLFYVFTRKDTKNLSKTLFNNFKSLRDIVFADRLKIEKLGGFGKSTSRLFCIVREIFSRILMERVYEAPIIVSSSHVLDYYKNTVGILKKEQLRIMFLNNKNKLISEEILQTGTINHTSIYPREIVQKALEYGASAMIMVHNHPSGDSKPSRQDVIVTRTLKEIARKLDIILLDHLIIGKGEVSSLNEMGLIP
jgi:DNA repair protein RadC